MLLQLLLAGPLILPISGAEWREDCDSGTRDLTNLWLINSHPPSYLFGTMHVKVGWDSASDQAKKAFESSEKLFVESTNPVGGSCEIPREKELPRDLIKRIEKYIDWAREQLKDDFKLLTMLELVMKDWQNMSYEELRKSQYNRSCLNLVSRVDQLVKCQVENLIILT